MSQHPVSIPVPPGRTPAAPSEPVPTTAQGRFKLDPRYIAPLFITCVLIVAQLSYGVLESYVQTFTAIGTAIATELILGRDYYR